MAHGNYSLEVALNALRAALRASVAATSSGLGVNATIDPAAVKEQADSLVALLEYEAAYKDPDGPRPQKSPEEWQKFEAETALASTVPHIYRVAVSNALAAGQISAAQVRDSLTQSEFVR